MERSSYWKYSSFYFLFFASMGAFMPYWGLYLKELGFEPQQVSMLIAMVQATKIIAPNFWGWLADRSGKRVSIIRLGTMLAAFFFAGVIISSLFWWIGIIMVLFSFFWNAVLPQFEAATLSTLGEKPHRYTSIRLWGSVGFIATVTTMGRVLELFGMSPLPWAVLVALFCLWINTLLIKEQSSQPQEQSDLSLASTLRKPAVIGLLAACLFMQASHGPYYTFFTIYLEDYGYSRTAAGQLWALGVAAEVGIFLIIHRWLRRFGAWKLLLTALAVALIRWLVVAALAAYPAALFLAQLMHAATFGVYHAAAIQLIHAYFPGNLQGRGQALYSSLSFGLGSALGSLASGYVWAGMGGSWAFVLGAVLAALGFASGALGMYRHTGNKGWHSST